MDCCETMSPRHDKAKALISSSLGQLPKTYTISRQKDASVPAGNTNWAHWITETKGKAIEVGHGHVE